MVVEAWVGVAMAKEVMAKAVGATVAEEVAWGKEVVGKAVGG